MLVNITSSFIVLQVAANIVDNELLNKKARSDLCQRLQSIICFTSHTSFPLFANQGDKYTTHILRAYIH